MRIRSVEARRGWHWIVEGFGLFRRSPFMWIVLTLVLALIWMMLFAIQVIGPLLFNLLSPVFFAGLMLGCRALEQGGELELPHLFAGFRTHAAALVTVGGVYLVGMIVILGLVFLTAGGGMLPAALSGKPADMAAIMEAMRSLLLALTVAFAVYIPLLMAVWFAPLLIAFHGLAAVPAMKLSFQACWRNLLPFTLYGLVILLLWFVASIPLLLGLLIVLPVVLCSIYASYKDVFETEARLESEAGGERREAPRRE
jgi:uncharacterized membrane protein